MRDPERIADILGKIEILWLDNPDQRFGQLMSNIMYGMTGFGRDPSFNIEDDRLTQHLEVLLEKGFYNRNEGVEIAPVN